MVAIGVPVWGYLASIALAGGIASLAVAWHRGRRPGRSATAVAVTVALVLIVAAPRPLAGGPDRDDGPQRLRTDDGHIIAYELIDAASEEGTVPLVFLHGGPGVSTRAQDVAWLAGLSRTRPVVAYDQIGAGGSSRLEDPAGYSLQRAQEDLEQFRRHLGLDRMILVGHSWGAVVAADYASHHPEHVEAIVALAPGALAQDLDVADDPSVRLRGKDRFRLMSHLLRPRELYTYALSQVDVRAAHRIADDAEMDRRYDAILRSVWPAMFCDPHLASGLPPPSSGFYAHQGAQRAHRATASPAPGVALPPTLVVKPQCDYLSWSVVDGFVDLFGAEVVYVEEAGHALHLEQRDLVTQVVEDFLAGRAPGGVLEDPKEAPRSFEGPP